MVRSPKSKAWRDPEFRTYVDWVNEFAFFEELLLLKAIREKFGNFCS